MTALTQAALVGADLLSSAKLALGDGWLSAALLIAAAGWQLTAAKAACLEQCQSPLKFVMRYWQPGAVGAMRLVSSLLYGVSDFDATTLACSTLLLLLLALIASYLPARRATRLDPIAALRVT